MNDTKQDVVRLASSPWECCYPAAWVASSGPLSVYQGSDLGTMLVHDGQLVFCERDSSAYFEMMVHVPLCVHPNPKRVLVVGGGTGGVVAQLAQHVGVTHIDVVDLWHQYFKTLQEYVPWRPTQDDRVTLHTESFATFLAAATLTSYEVILVDSLCENPTMNREYLFQLKSLLSHDGIMVLGMENWWQNAQGAKQTLGWLSDGFSVVLPYRYEGYSYAGYGGSLAFASTQYHPLADIILQKSDFLEYLHYYNSEVHLAAFALTQRMRQDLHAVIKA